MSKISLYYEDGKSKGYLNVPLIIARALEHKCFIILGIGGRGTGKTYGGLDFCEESNLPFIYMRRKQKHVNIACRPELSPFKKLNSDKKRSTYCFKIPDTDVAGIYNTEINEKDVPVPTGMPKGYMLALTTFHDTRSVDFSDVKLLFYDEFIPEKRERRISDEGYTFNNIYETINRNRELDGEIPLICFCFANSEKIDNALFMYYGIVKIAMDMRKKGKEILFLEDKGICLVDMVNSPISHRKSETFLYSKANKNNKFSEMAIGNEFDIDTAVNINDNVQIVQYKPLVTLGEITIYRHKSKSEYYMSYHRSGNPVVYPLTAMSIAQYKRKYSYINMALLKDKVIFEDYTAYVLYMGYMQYK